MFTPKQRQGSLRGRARHSARGRGEQGVWLLGPQPGRGPSEVGECLAPWVLLPTPLSGDLSFPIGPWRQHPPPLPWLPLLGWQRQPQVRPFSQSLPRGSPPTSGRPGQSVGGRPLGAARAPQPRACQSRGGRPELPAGPPLLTGTRVSWRPLRVAPGPCSPLPDSLHPRLLPHAPKPLWKASPPGTGSIPSPGPQPALTHEALSSVLGPDTPLSSAAPRMRPQPRGLGKQQVHLRG